MKLLESILQPYVTVNDYLFLERCRRMTDIHMNAYPELAEYDYFEIYAAIIIAESKRLEEEKQFDSLIDYNDEIVSIEEIGEQEVMDITVDGDSLFYGNNILTKNSYGMIFGLDCLIGIVTTDEFRAQNKILFKALKNRYQPVDKDGKFFMAVDYPTMTLTDFNLNSTNYTGKYASDADFSSSKYNKQKMTSGNFSGIK